MVAAKREQVIGDSHLEEGGVAGAAREALSIRVTPKALGMEVWAEKSALPAPESMWRWPCFLISAWDIWMRCVSVWGIGPFDRMSKRGDGNIPFLSAMDAPVGAGKSSVRRGCQTVAFCIWIRERCIAPSRGRR